MIKQRGCWEASWNDSGARVVCTACCRRDKSVRRQERKSEWDLGVEAFQCPF